MTTFLTFSTQSFLPRAKVCVESIKQYHPEAKVKLVELDEPTVAGTYVPNLPKLRLEKARELILLGHEQVVVIGADCVLYHNINSFLDMYGDIVLIPHVVSPPTTNGAALYKTGHVNADLMLFRKSSLPMLDWLLKQELVDRSSEGIFYEQTWLSALPFFFDNVTICKAPAINYAYFNFHERELGMYGDRYYVNGRPLALAQFSGYVEGQPERASKYHSGTISGVTLQLFQEYENSIRSFQ